MSSKEKLTIHKIIFDLQLDSKEAFKHFADRFSRMAGDALPKRLDEVLNKHQIPNGKLVVQKMEINLGKLPPHRFENKIIEGIAEEFDTILKRFILEIENEISKARFKSSRGGKIRVSNIYFSFESEIILEKSTHLDSATLAKERLQITNLSEEVQKEKKQSITADIEEQLYTKKTDPLVELPKDSSTRREESQKPSHVNVKPSIDLPPELGPANFKIEKPNISVQAEKEKQKEKQKQSSEPTSLFPDTDRKKTRKKVTLLEQIQDLEKLPDTLPSKANTDLEKALLYYIRYGRFPSNVKYELGMKMLDVLNVNQLDIRYFKDLKRHVDRDSKAKERLIRLSDQANRDSFVKKEIFKSKEVFEFDPKIPKSFEDYFIALALNRDVGDFSAALQRYTINDMVRFFYADHPQKLKAIITYLVSEIEKEGTLEERIKNLFEKLGKSSIVKIIASFIRKAGHVNKYLNQLNKKSGKSIKAAHSSVLLALIQRKDPLAQLKIDGFDISHVDSDEFNIEPRVFLKPAPTYAIKEFSNAEMLNYFLTYGTLPHSASSTIPSIERLSVIILMLSQKEIKDLPFFKDRNFENALRYQSVGLLSIKAIEHLIKALSPGLVEDLMTKYKYFEFHIKSGIPSNFQKTFLLHYALHNRPVSYLEEMINFWKVEFGDADQVIKKRWVVSEELSKELNKILYIKEESVKDLLKVDYEFESYSKDISVKNAGLIILWPFLKVYFNMLDLLDSKGDFRSMEERGRACHLLQYLAVKQSEGEEFYYPLNKILTGYPLDEPLSYEIKMTEKEIDVSNALLNNVIKQWNALKGSSVDALRGSFLIRDGILTPSTNGWLLTVEKKAYDILLDKLPWGIGMIKLSWAPYVLSVEWERNIM